jgi:hypothetical protein
MIGDDKKQTYNAYMSYLNTKQANDFFQPAIL